MMLWHIKDYGLTVEQLEEKYSPDGDSWHPTFNRSGWVRAVNLDATLASYWEWVHHRLVLEQEELDADSPYN